MKKYFKKIKSKLKNAFNITLDVIKDLFILSFYFLYFIFSWTFMIVIMIPVIVIHWTVLKLFKDDIPPLSKTIKINTNKKVSN